MSMPDLWVLQVLPKDYKLELRLGTCRLIHSPCDKAIASPTDLGDEAIGPAINWHEKVCEGDPMVAEPIQMLQDLTCYSLRSCRRDTLEGKFENRRFSSYPERICR